jgi:hypothetical protein
MRKHAVTDTLPAVSAPLIARPSPRRWWPKVDGHRIRERVRSGCMTGCPWEVVLRADGSPLSAGFGGITGVTPGRGRAASASWCAWRDTHNLIRPKLCALGSYVPTPTGAMGSDAPRVAQVGR